MTKATTEALTRRLCAQGCQCHRHKRPVRTHAGLHSRVYVARGRAADQLCVQCDRPAKDWATVHGEDGRDPWADYVPLCRQCHCQYDGHQRKRSTTKIDAAAASKIRERYAAGEGQRELGAEFGITKSTVSLIVRNEIWK